MRIELDHKQTLELLRLLEENSHLDIQTLATLLDVTADDVQQTMQRLEEKNIIVKYRALINWDKVDVVGSVKAMIEVKVTPQRDVGFDEVAARIYKFPEVKNVYLMSGTYDLSVIVHGKSINDVALFVSQKLSTLDHVESTATHFMLKTYKHDGVVFDDPENDQRMIVTP